MANNKIDADKLKELGISWKKPEKPSTEIFHDLQDNKLDSIKETIKEINDLIEQRKELSKEVDSSIEKLKTAINNFILDFSDANPNEKMNMKRKLVEVEEFKIQERINCWKDVARLKEELRGHVKEARDTEKRRDVLNKLMEE